MTRPSLSLVRRFFITLLALAIIAPAMLSQRPLVAQQEADKPAADAAANNEDLFKVPEGDAKAIHEYMRKLAKTPPEGDSQEEQAEFAIKALSSLVTAADRLLAAKPNERQALEAQGFRLEALQALVAMEHEGAREQLEKAMQAARKSDNEQIVGMGWQAFINQRTNNWAELSAADKDAFRKEIVDKIKAGGPQPIDASIVTVAAMRLDGADDEFLVGMLEEVAPLFEKAESEEVKTAVQEANFAGILRRLKLPGGQMEITGELLSGGEVDWESYRGKVVLVDFWATWCGPCRAEIPNVLAMYEAYHDKGFDVLGVSLDRTAEDAKQYVEQNKLPWDSLFPAKEEDRFWNHPLAKHYGIGGIPTAILVDKDGKVVHMNARDETLREELQRLLGDPVEKPKAAKPAAKKAAEAS